MHNTLVYNIYYTLLCRLTWLFLGIIAVLRNGERALNESQGGRLANPDKHNENSHFSFIIDYALSSGKTS